MCTPSCGGARRRPASRCRNTCSAGLQERHGRQASRTCWRRSEDAGGTVLPTGRRRSRPRRQGRALIDIDASVVVVALGEDTKAGALTRERLAREQLVAPEILDLEVLSTWRRLSRRGLLPLGRAAKAVADLSRLPVQRAPHRPLLGRCWELRDTVTVYDAVYLALAEALAVPLLTADARLARAGGPRCTVEILE